MNKKDAVFLGFGLVLQLIVYILTKNTLLSLISGLFGVTSVVLCSQRKLSFYFFGFAQLISYVILCINEKLYGEIAENIFYAITMIYGIVNWGSNYNVKTKEVKTRNLTKRQNSIVIALTAIVTILLFIILSKTNDSQPFMDSVTTVPAFVAQILMILRYKESWYYWMIIDIGSIAMWSMASDWCMVAQFVFWTANCIYGLKKW